jgi:hypothetical protein
MTAGYQQDRAGVTPGEAPWVSPTLEVDGIDDGGGNGVPGAIRTPGLQIRSLTLYPG